MPELRSAAHALANQLKQGTELLEMKLAQPLL
jgi:hypothetical protein